ncbi:MAG: hypothetical protein U9Q18_06845 [Caldisericota bacterium]|nr:hypothetical protein [Thermotogota bacterium]MEA3314076.1 hypothetical protein [Caldisericota bacterium]
MSKMEEIIKNEIDNLVDVGNKIVNKAISIGSEMEGKELAEVTSWVTRLGQLIRKLYGTDSQQFSNYTQALNTKNFYFIHSNWSAQISQMLGIAISVKHDYEKGLLVNIRALVQADIFADFLEMGEYLLKKGYKDAATVIIGTVLEDSLRKLCDKNGISTNGGNGIPLTIDPLNAALAKADVYSKLVQKQITTWAHVRNKAAHGEYQEYDKNQTEMMLLFVQNFAEQYLT